MHKILSFTVMFVLGYQKYATDQVVYSTSSISETQINAGGNVSAGNTTIQNNFYIKEAKMNVSTDSSHPINTSSPRNSSSEAKEVQDYHPFLNRIVELQGKYENLLNVPSNKNVVALLGRTGSGKSTIANFLSGKKMRSNHDNDFELENAADQTAFPIGHSGISETQYPKTSSIAGDLVLFDLPGFDRTGENTAEHFMDALFIKEIFLKASSVRILLVINENEIIAGRGQEFKSFFERLGNVFESDLTALKQSTLLLINRWTKKTTEPKKFCSSKLSGHIPSISDWFENGEFVVSTAADLQNQDDIAVCKNHILSRVKDMTPIKITNCRMECMYPKNIEEDFSDVLCSLMLNDFILYTQQPEETLSKMKNAFEIFGDTFWDNFANKLKNNISVQFFKTVSEQHYQDCFLEFKKTHEEKVDLLKNKFGAIYDRLKAEKNAEYLALIDKLFDAYEISVQQRLSVREIERQFLEYVSKSTKGLFLENDNASKEILANALINYKMGKIPHLAKRVSEKIPEMPNSSWLSGGSSRERPSR